MSVLGPADLAPDRPVYCRLTTADGSIVEFTATHAMSPERIEWSWAGGALNLIRARRRLSRPGTRRETTAPPAGAGDAVVSMG